MKLLKHELDREWTLKHSFGLLGVEMYSPQNIHTGLWLGWSDTGPHIIKRYDDDPYVF